MAYRFNSTPEERMAAWVNGDLVTHRHTGDPGTVKWTHARHSDGKRFVRVRFADGRETWANDDYLLGHGAHQVTCADCGEPFRTDDQRATFCPCCARQHQPDYDPHADTIEGQRLRLRGNATTHAPAPASAPGPRRPEDDPYRDTPF